MLVQVPAEPSKHRVAVWRELRKAGAVPVSQGVWALPAAPAFEPSVERVRQLCVQGGGLAAVFDAAPREPGSEELVRSAYAAARGNEWSEFLGDCAKFQAEIEREVTQGKFTFGELEEEEQSLDRLRRWFRELRRRDVLGLPAGETAAAALRACEEALEAFAEEVYTVAHRSAPAIDLGAGPAPDAFATKEGNTP